MVASVSALSPGVLPISRTCLIGRETERAAAWALLVEEAAPLLTLSGPGGVGKTRLALAVAADSAEQFANGVVWVDLAPLSDAELVPVTIASALGIVPRPHRPILAELAEHLQRQQLLLVLDNCEHLLTAVADIVASLLAACPALQILAASRAPLRVRGEQLLPIEPLPVPQLTEPGSVLAENDAVRLFVERTRAVRPGFALTGANAETIAALCRALDGLPLAIELAAARMTILSPEVLLAQMTDRLSLLTDGPRDAPLRQQTIEATIEWSAALLSNEANALFRRLAVFAGGFTLTAAHAVASHGKADLTATVRGLNALVDQSLVYRIEDEGEPRFRMLETIRAYALGRLQASGEDAWARDRHAAWFLDLVVTLEAWVAAYLPQGQALLDQLETEHGNLHAALTWLRERGDVTGLLTLAGELLFFWQLRGHLREGRQWLEWGLARGDKASPVARACGELALATIAAFQHQSREALALVEDSLRYFRSVGDVAHIARAAAHAATVSLDIGGPELTDAYLTEAIAAFDALGDVAWTRHARSQMQILPGIIAKNRDEAEVAERRLQEVVATQRQIARETGSEQPFACWPLMAWGAVAHLVRDLPLAMQRYQASLAHAWRHHEARCSAYALTRVASILAMSGHWREGAWLLGAAEAYAEKIGLAFDLNIWALTRAFGVPEPWQGPDDYVGQARAIRTAVNRRWPFALTPIPEPETAASLWASGRGVPIDEAVRYALGVEFGAFPPPSPLTLPTVVASQDYGLTPRQQEILNLLCQRLTDREIAERLFLSARTVEGHVTQILGKFGVANRREATAFAVRQGLVEPRLSLAG